MPLFYQPNILDGQLFLDSDESRHCSKVLRLKPGNSIDVINGFGDQFTCEITNTDARKCSFKILKREKEAKVSRHQIHIAIAPTKNIDRIEWFVEKAIEIGVHEISFIQCHNSERTKVNMDRVHRKAVSAMKQSGNIRLPKINELTSFKNFMSECKTKTETEQRFICYVDQTNPLSLKDEVKSDEKYCVLIGPEGDFSGEELKLSESLDFKKVNLGKSRLRTETAGIAACHILNILNE